MSTEIWSQTDFRNARNFAIGKMEKNADTLIIRVSSERDNVFSGGAVDNVTVESFSGGEKLASRTGLIRRKYLEDLLSAGTNSGAFGSLEKFLEKPRVELRVEMNKTIVENIIKLERLEAKLEEIEEKSGMDSPAYLKTEKKVDKLGSRLEEMTADPKNYKIYLHNTQTGEMYDLERDYWHPLSDVPSLISKRSEPTETKKPKKRLRA